MRLVVPFLLVLGVLCGAMMVTSSGESRADLVIVDRSDVYTLDPQRMSFLRDCRMAYALYEGLVTWDPDDFSPIAATAASWSVSPDGLTWEFTLRDDARWSNGAPVVAQDFVYSLRRLLLPDTAADYSNLLFVIRGARAFFDWRARALEEFDDAEDSAAELWSATLERFEDTVGLRATDDRTLVIELERPTGYFADLLAFAVCLPVYQPCVEGWPADWDGSTPPPFSERAFLDLDAATGRVSQDHRWARPETLVGNGPYVLEGWRYRRDLLLRGSATYHSPDSVATDSVAILTIEHANTRVLSFDSGAADLLMSVGVEYEPDMFAQRAAYIERHREQFDQLRSDGLDELSALARLPEPRSGERRDIHAFPAFGVEFYNFNCRDRLNNGSVNPFADARVRRAFSQAIDRSIIVRDITRLNEPVIHSFIPPGSIPGYEPAAGVRFDRAASLRGLEDTGWRDRDGDGAPEHASGAAFPVVELVFPSDNPRYRWVALELRSQWQQALGVTVELRSVDGKFFKEELKQGDFMIAPGRWYGDYGDPTTFLDTNRSGDGNNDRGYGNAAFDALLDEAATIADPDARFALLREAEALLLQDSPFMVTCQLMETLMFDPSRVEGVCVHPRQTHRYQLLHRVKPRDVTP